MAYGARLESVLGETPHGFKSRILRQLVPADSVGRTRYHRLRLHQLSASVTLGMVEPGIRKGIEAFDTGQL